MTQSTPPPDQGWSDRPATTTDPTSAPPAPSSWPAASTGSTEVATVARPGLVTAAGVLLIVLGVLTLIIGVFGLLGAAMFAGAAGSLGETADAPTGMMGAFAGVIVVFVVLIFAWGVLQIVAGAKTLSGRNWARITGIVIGVIGVLLFLAGLANPDAGGGIIVSIVIAAAYAFIVIALAMGGSWFRARSA